MDGKVASLVATLRLFLSVEIDAAIRARLGAMQERLREAVPDADVRWVEPENIHLTVAFLGDQPATVQEAIDEGASTVAARVAPFRIGVRGGSAFPRRGPLKTLWVGVSDGASEWRNMAEQVAQIARPWGAPPGNDLVSHMTLGRVRSKNAEQEQAALRAALAAERETDCGEQCVDRMVLMQSFLNPTGATYQALSHWPLTGSGSSGGVRLSPPPSPPPP